MLKSLSFFSRYFLFWILFFFFNRLTFELWNFSSISRNSFIEITKTFLFGIHMDASMAAYICVIPFLYFGIAWLFNLQPLRYRFIAIYSYILIVITSLLSLIDINIYREWGSKLNYRAVDLFLTSTGDALASTASSPLFTSMISFIILSVLGIFLYQKIALKTSLKKSPLLFKIPTYLFVLAFTFLAIRGGWGVAPMNTSKVYFSDKPILNHAAINTNWYLMSNVIGNKSSTKNPYTYFGEAKKKQIINDLFSKADSLDNKKILKTTKPNIVLIIMESFTADIVEELGGEKGVSPNFSKSVKEGVLFTHIYSASDRTDKGLVAILSAYPSQAIKSVIKDNDKQEKLPSISNELKKAGYQTSFFYGGDTDFSNFKSYILSHDFKDLTDVKNFKSEEVESSWGAYDGVNFTKQLQYLNQQKQPFFSTILTLSNHEPFQLPTKGKFGNNNSENKFRSTSYYTDGALWDYINSAKKQSWYNNTLFIIVADHGHRLPKSVNEIYNPARYHIPLLFFGGALREEWKGKRIDKFGSQVDIASILLNQLNLPDTAFHYSKNLLNHQTKGFAFYSWDNGFGFIDAEKSISYDPIGNQIIFNIPLNLENDKKQIALTKAKAIMQSVYDDYINY